MDEFIKADKSCHNAQGFKMKKTMLNDTVTSTATNILIDDKKLTQWSNNDNQTFYEAITVEGIKQFSQKGGLSNGCDIHLLKPHWINAKSVLEVGTGYGRVIKSLLENNFSGKITAIERSNTLFDYLEKNYSSKANLIKADICKYNNIQERFDVIFWLWSGIADFAPHEQMLTVIKLSQLLSVGGKLIIDTMPENVIPLMSNQNQGKQVFLTTVNNATVHTYEPRSEEIKQYGKLASLTNYDLISCPTDTQRKRWLHILSK